MLFIDDTTWLNFTNFALGIVVLLSAIVIGYVFATELYNKFKLRHSNAHALYIPDIGLTMADGGEEIKVDENLKDFHL